jgi:hypothetical protein
MVANCDRTCPLLRRVLIAASAFAIGFSLSAAAQTTTTAESSDGQSYSSSSIDYHALLSTDSLLPGSSYADPSDGSPSGSPQYGGGRRSSSSYPNYEGRTSHIAIEAGAGFTAPLGNDTNFSTADLTAGYLSPAEGWGYNITVGAGWNFSKRFGALVEYQFDRQGITSAYLNELDAACNASGGSSSSGSCDIGGNINTWSFTLDPIIYLPMNHKSGFYATGGGGFYRKITNFTEPVEECDIYYGCYGVPATVDHFSSNQGGLNIGAGFYHKVFGEDSRGKLYAEVRYVWVDSPVANSSNSYQGEGTESLIPVTFGIRF